MAKYCKQIVEETIVTFYFFENIFVNRPKNRLCLPLIAEIFCFIKVFAGHVTNDSSRSRLSDFGEA